MGFDAAAAERSSWWRREEAADVEEEEEAAAAAAVGAHLRASSSSSLSSMATSILLGFLLSIFSAVGCLSSQLRTASPYSLEYLRGGRLAVILYSNGTVVANYRRGYRTPRPNNHSSTGREGRGFGPVGRAQCRDNLYNNREANNNNVCAHSFFLLISKKYILL